jgi:hypothetical protein
MRGELPKTSNSWTESAVRRIWELAERQHGVVALRQLPELGFSASTVRSQVAAGRLHRIYQGVYALGHRVLRREGYWIAAVLACGPGAALSHRDCAALAGLRRSARRAIEVTAPRRLRIPGIDTHTTKLTSADVTVIDGIPCTTVARTLLDLAAVIDRRSLERAINQAEILQLFDLRAVNATLERAGRRRGTRALRETLTDLDPLIARTRNELEEAFLAGCRRSGLPLPDVNAWLTIDGHTFRPDFLWRSHRLIVETDGWETHSTRRAFERDRRRDLLLLRAHYRTVRVTWRQVFGAWPEVAAGLRPLLV